MSGRALWRIGIACCLAPLATAACAGGGKSSGDAASIRDAGPPDVLYWQWWYPDCGAPPGAPCSNPACMPVMLSASARGGCAYGDSVATGCVPADMGSLGWSTYMTTDDRLLGALEEPYTTTGVSLCGEEGQGLQQDPRKAGCCGWTLVDDGGPGG